jgi:3-phosphoshikimate 1-carboxyvinyltransferase
MMFALLAKGNSTLMNVLDSEDTTDAINICKHLGAEVTLENNTLTLNSLGLPLNSPANILYTGNSGISTRFIMPILGLRKNTLQPIILDCGSQMRARPIDSLVSALRQLGMTIDYIKNNNTLPVRISGDLIGGKTTVSGITSQYLSALLISLPCAPSNSEVIVKNLNERPYVEMTLEWLKQQNILYTHHKTNEIDVFTISGRQTYHNFHITIPGDFSSASYLIAVAVLIPGQVILQGLNMQDSQGDKHLITLLQEMGANIVVTHDQLTIYGGKKLIGMPIDANDFPDLLPTLAVIGTQALGETIIYNVPQARIKETDRIHSMTEGLTRLGASIQEKNDGMIIQSSKLRGAPVKGYGDHRTVMGLSLAGLIASETTTISNAESVNKTFPEFINSMRSLGAQMDLMNE